MGLNVTSAGASMPGVQGNNTSGQPQFGQSIEMGGEPAWEQVANKAYAAAAQTSQDVYFAQAREAAKKRNIANQNTVYTSPDGTVANADGDTVHFSGRAQT